MEGSGFHTDDSIFSSSCACWDYLEADCQLHMVIIKNNFASNLVVGNTSVDK